MKLKVAGADQRDRVSALSADRPLSVSVWIWGFISLTPISHRSRDRRLAGILGHAVCERHRLSAV